MRLLKYLDHRTVKRKIIISYHKDPIIDRLPAVQPFNILKFINSPEMKEKKKIIVKIICYSILFASKS